jgi:hypothetical protein
MEVPVKVLLRVTCRWWDRLFVTMESQVDFPSCGHIDCLLSNLLQELTTAEPSAEWAINYRREYHRSLRDGDVVVIGETAWALEPSGDEWTRVALQADEVVVVDGLSRMRHRQSYTNRWRGDWRACMRADVAESQGGSQGQESAS